MYTGKNCLFHAVLTPGRNHPSYMKRRCLWFSLNSPVKYVCAERSRKGNCRKYGTLPVVASQASLKTFRRQSWGRKAFWGSNQELRNVGSVLYPSTYCQITFRTFLPECDSQFSCDARAKSLWGFAIWQLRDKGSRWIWGIWLFLYERSIMGSEILFEVV